MIGQFESNGLRTRNIDVLEEEDVCPSLSRERKTSFPLPFSLIQISNSLHMGKSIFFSQLTDSNVSLFQKHSQTFPEVRLH
jgi:hypothetical protein